MSLLARGLRWDAREAVSGAGGSFQFAGLPSGTYELFVTKKGYAATREPVVVTVDDGSVHGLEVQIREGGAITGRLVGIELTDLDEIEIRAGYLAAGEVRYDKTYRIVDLEPGDWTVTARLPRSGRQTEGRVTLEPGVAEVLLDLVFDTGLTLTGQALHNGAPLGGAEVSLRGIDVSASARGETDVGGTFRLDGLKPGEYQLLLASPRIGLRHTENLEIISDRTIRIDLATGAIRGFVVDDYGSLPLAGAQVSLIPPAGDARTAGRATTTDSQGSFRFSEVTTGRWGLVCSKSGYGEEKTTVAVEAGVVLDDVMFELAATQGLRLDVRLATGRFPETIHAAVIDAGGRIFAAGTYPVGENGRVRLTTVPPGTWQLLVSADGAAAVARRPVSATEPVEVVLPSGGALNVRARELAANDELATLTLAWPDGRRYRTIVSGGRIVGKWPVRHGHALVEGLPEGRWIVRVATKDRRSWIASGESFAGVVTDLIIEGSAEPANPNTE